MSLSRSGRRIVYTNQVPFETDVLYTNIYNMVNAAYVAFAALGSGNANATLVAGIPVTQNGSPNLTVNIGAGVMFNFQQFDATNFGVVPADTASTDDLYKLYIQTTLYNSAANTTQANAIGLPLTFTPPGSGTTNYLLQATFLTQDTDVANRPYFNPANPPSPTYASAPQTRNDTIYYSLKSAVSPSIPTPDAGYVGLYVIAVASGATQILNANITVYSAAPFITETLTQKVSYQNLQNSSPIFGVDSSGSANAIVATTVPPITVINSAGGTHLYVKIANTNTGATTLNPSGLGAVAVNKSTLNGLVALGGGELVAGAIHEFMYDGSVFQLLDAFNPIPYSYSVFNLGTGQSLSANTPTLLVWDSVNYADPYGVITFTASPTYKMTANVIGLYNVSAIVEVGTSTLDTKFILMIYVNGSLYTVLESGFIRSTSLTATFNGSTIIPLSANDYVEIYGEFITNTGTIAVGSASNAFQMTYLG